MRDLDRGIARRRLVRPLQRIHHIAEILLEIARIHHEEPVAAVGGPPGIGHQIIPRPVAAHRHHVVDVVGRARRAHPRGVALPPRVERIFRIHAAHRHAPVVQKRLQLPDLLGRRRPFPQPHIVRRAPMQPLREIRRRRQRRVLPRHIRLLRQRRPSIAHEDLERLMPVSPVILPRVDQVVGEPRRALVARHRHVQRRIPPLHVRRLGVIGPRPMHAGPLGPLALDRRKIAPVVRRPLQRLAALDISFRRLPQHPPLRDPSLASPLRIRLLPQRERPLPRHEPRQPARRARLRLRPSDGTPPQHRRHHGNPPTATLAHCLPLLPKPAPLLLEPNAGHHFPS